MLVLSGCNADFGYHGTGNYLPGNRDSSGANRELGSRLADVGAQVICIDPDTDTMLLSYLNHGKAVAADAKVRREGLAAAHLIARERQPKDWVASPYDLIELRQINASAIVVTISPYGETGGVRGVSEISISEATREAAEVRASIRRVIRVGCSKEQGMYKGLSKGLQTRRDKGIRTTRKGWSKGPKNGRPKTKAHIRLEATAEDTQLTTWRRYVENCRTSGTTPFVPPDIRRKLGLDE